MAELPDDYYSLYDAYNRIKKLPSQIIDSLGIKAFEYVQSTISQVWDIEHNLNSNFIMVQCYDANNLQIIPAEILNVDSNTMRLTFGEPIKGLAKLMTKSI